MQFNRCASTCMTLVNLFSLPLSIYYATFEELWISDFTCTLLLPSLLLGTQMRIGQTGPQQGGPLQVTVFLLETTSCLGLLSASRLSLVPVLRLNTKLCFLFIRLAGEQHRRSLLGWLWTIAARVTPRFILSTHSYTNPYQVVFRALMSGNEDHHRQGRRFAAGGNEHDGRDPRDVEIERLRQQVRDLEKQHEIRQIQKRIRELELQRELTKETESEPIIWDIGDEEEEYLSFDSYPQSFEPIYPDIFSKDEPSIFTFDDIERNKGEKGLVEGDGPTVVTGGPVASMATLPFLPKVQAGLLVVARFTKLNLEGDLIKSPITVGSPINFKWQNKDNIVVAKNAQRKDYEGPTTTSLDVLNSLSSKIATTKCVGAELFERFKLIAKSDRSNAPYDPGGKGLILGETTREVKLFRRVMVTLINGSRVDVPFDPGDFAPKAKLEDKFF
nr:reverse transcriptase domain-containing protein [Tanacetum cinerariifolium]